jgi:hypothetical protein
MKPVNVMLCDVLLTRFFISYTRLGKASLNPFNSCLDFALTNLLSPTTFGRNICLRRNSKRKMKMVQI